MHDPVSSTQAETARADSERQYRELVQNANSAIIRWRRDGTIIFFNEWAQKFFGYSAEEAVGKHISLLVPGRESTGRDLSPMVQDIVEHPGKYENNTNENVCRDGRRVWMAWTNRPITNPDGTVEEILSVGTDITELVRTEQALRESEARLKKVLEAETVGVMFWDLSTGCLVDANDTFLNMMGHSRRDVAERSLTWQKLTAPEYIEQSLAEIRKFQETGRVGPYEKEYLRKDGTRQWFVFAGSSIGKDACVEFCVDISDRKNAEAALRASEGRYRTLFNEATEGIGLADAETGTILECNRAFAALTGYSREELIGMPQSMLHPPRDVRGGVSQTFELHRTSQRGVVIPTEIITKSGETKHVEIKANVVELGGRRASLAFFRDVTEELLHEREREIMVRLLRLLSEQGDTHELVRGLTALLQEWSGCESVGVRLREADDYPYFETRGFGAEFVRLETSLCCRGANGEILRDEDGMPLLECTCGDVLRGRFDPSWPFCTQKGSFWVNSITELATTLPGILHRPHARNRCIDEGYESVALIPLRSGGATHGLLQLNDRSKGRFSPELLAFLENVADQFAMALTQRQAQAALRESEEHYRSLFSNMINGLAYCRILLDDQGRPEDFIYLAVNDAFEALTGLGGVVGKKVSEVIPGILEKDHELIETYARVALTGVPERFERWVEALQMWFHISAYSPQREHFVAIFEVVTERKQAEVALRQSEERYRELVQHANSAILRYRGGDGAITFFNEYAQSFFGYGLEEILGKNVSILLPETDSSGADLSQLVADIVKHPGRYVNNENENICRDGRRVWMAWTNRVLPDAAGRVNEILAVGTDITERKRAQDEQDRLDRQRQLALNAAHLGWWHYDHASGTSTGDQRYREIFGISGEESPNYKILTLLHPDDLPNVLCKVEAALDPVNPQSYSAEYRVCRKDGSVVWVEAHGIASFEGSGPLRHAANFVGTVEDITGRKKAEEEMLRLNRALRILSECNEALVRAASEEGLLQRVCELIGNIGGYTLVWVGLVDGEDAGILRIAASRAAEPGYLERICITPDRYEFRDGPAGCAMKTGRPVLVRDAQTDPRFGPWREAAGIHGYSSILCLPLQAPDRVLGTVAIYADHVDGFDSEEIALLAEMSNDLAYGIFSLRAQAEREQAEASLTASEERYRALVDSAPGGIIVYNDVGIVYANSVAVALCGLDSFEQLRERGILGVIHPEERAEVAKRMRQGLSGQDLPMRETRLLRPDGTVAFIDTIARPVQYGGSAAVQVYVHDITERKRSEEQLRKLSVAVQQSTVIVVITGLNGVIEYVNPMFTEVTGYATEEVIGLTPRILKSGETPREEYEVLWKTITSGGEWRGEFHNRRKDGTLYWERALIAPVRNSAGAMTHFLAIKEDITQQKVLEEQYRQAQKMEAVGQLAGGVAHDFNNILQSMLGYSGLLVDRLPKESETREFANEIARGTERATALTRQLLAFSRRQVLEMKDLDVNDVVHGVVKMIRRLIGEDIEVQVAATCRLGTVHADAGQLEQVLLNLCVNARDAMPGGGMLTIETDNVTIDAEYCETHSWAAPGMYLLLSVTDTGHGMDAQTQARIFEPFFTTKELGKGTGLGLATVYGIVKQHNGMIQVYSEAGRGTAFKIYLPSVERAATTKESENAKPVQGGTETILVAEDDEVVRKLAVRILRLSGYTVLEATDGQEALEVFQQYAADIALLLLDVVMPKLGGKAVYEALKPKHPHLQFLFSSGYSANAIHTGFVLDEGIELIQKPYGPTALLRRVRDILDESKPETDL